MTWTRKIGLMTQKMKYSSGEFLGSPIGYWLAFLFFVVVTTIIYFL